MELFRNPEIDWLRKKWYFLAFSLVLSVAGVLSLLFWHHLPLDVDFKGGTVVRIRFAQTPDLGRLRTAADRAGLHDARIQRYGTQAGNEVLITLAEAQTRESALDQGRAAIVGTLEQHYASAFLEQANPEHLQAGEEANAQYLREAESILSFKDQVHGGLLPSIASLRGTATPAAVSALTQGSYLSCF